MPLVLTIKYLIMCLPINTSKDEANMWNCLETDHLSLALTDLFTFGAEIPC